MGNTGAGKSSVINALLDEEQLVPTNCMRACTAVVTAISYNFEDQPYRAEIEFISPSEWETELKTLSRDLVDSHGKIRSETSDDSTDAGKAYTKIKAVYPKFSKEKMSQTALSEYMNHENVKGLLGSTQKISDTDSLRFHRAVQRFVDSEDKTPTSLNLGKSGKEKPSKSMEFWPLIRVVRLFVKHEALANGATIVDLPGGHDSNAARAAVAARFMQQCTGLWIVSPIGRAVSDKAAKNLLGDSFKRQLLMDGNYNAVTFICSKMDEIGIQEALSSLPHLQLEFNRITENTKALEKIKEQIHFDTRRLRDLKADNEHNKQSYQDQYYEWVGLQTKLGQGKTVYAPSIKKKRAHGATTDRPIKKQRRDSFGDGGSEYSDSMSDSESDELDDSSTPEKRSEPLTMEQIQDKLKELGSQIKLATERSSKWQSAIKLKRRLVNDRVSTRVATNNTRMSMLCINGRNEYSVENIRRDFANGIKELDEQVAVDKDPLEGIQNPRARNYDQIGAALPVFCVSSKAYQKLSGRLPNDPAMGPAFAAAEDTNIPQLQNHCMKLTETRRTAAARHYLNQAGRIFTSLNMWGTDTSSETTMTDEQEIEMKELLVEGQTKLKTVRYPSFITEACCVPYYYQCVFERGETMLIDCRILLQQWMKPLQLCGEYLRQTYTNNSVSIERNAARRTLAWLRNLSDHLLL